jgi:hypothetical protein
MKASVRSVPLHCAGAAEPATAEPAADAAWAAREASSWAAREASSWAVREASSWAVREASTAGVVSGRVTGTEA